MVSTSKPTFDRAGTHDACSRKLFLNPKPADMPCAPAWCETPPVVISRFKEVFYDETSLAIVMEYASGGTLANCLRLRTSLPEEEARR